MNVVLIKEDGALKIMLSPRRHPSALISEVFKTFVCIWIPQGLQSRTTWAVCCYHISTLEASLIFSQLGEKQNTISSSVFNQLFIQYFNDQCARGDQRLSRSSAA